MKQNLMTDIVQGMLPYLNNAQSKRLQEVMQHTLVNYEVTQNTEKMKESEPDFVERFLSAKRIEGCSEKSLKYYKSTINAMLTALDRSVNHITTDDIRGYLTEYQQKNGLSKVTIDNIRRILSSFFSWLEDEDYILKNPVRRIHKVKTGTNIKETYSDEAMELMRDNCTEIRDLAIIDMLASTGMRVGEMVATIILLVYVDNSEKKKSMDEYVGTQKKKLEILDDILQNKFNIKNKEKVENLISIYQEYIDNETNKEKKRDKSIVAGFSALGGILTVTLENMELIGIGLDKWLYLAVFLFIFVVEAGITIYGKILAYMFWRRQPERVSIQ